MENPVMLYQLSIDGNRYHVLQLQLLTSHKASFQLNIPMSCIKLYIAEHFVTSSRNLSFQNCEECLVMPCQAINFLCEHSFAFYELIVTDFFAYFLHIRPTKLYCHK